MRNEAVIDLKFKRRRQGITNYKKRLALVKSGLDRVVVRQSSRRVLGQIVRYEEKGDKVIASADSAELLKQYGWPSRSNRATAYLTGLLLAKKAKAGEGELVLDTGLSSPVKDSIPFVFAKGCIDGGLKIIGNIEISESAYGAERMVKYEAALAKSQKGAKHFTAYEKSGMKVESLPALFKAARAKLTSG
jgi:large subunit ribosomal protein L18